MFYLLKGDYKPKTLNRTLQVPARGVSPAGWFLGFSRRMLLLVQVLSSDRLKRRWHGDDFVGTLRFVCLCMLGCDGNSYEHFKSATCSLPLMSLGLELEVELG